jgi:hypothetical protein
MAILRVPGNPKTDVADEHFARLFAIAPAHRLRRVSYDATGMDSHEWVHEEIDADGAIVASYTTDFVVGNDGAIASYTRRGVNDATLKEGWINEILHFMGKGE